MSGAIHQWTARETRQAIRNKQTSATEVVQALLARGPLVDRAAHPITFGTRKRPDPRAASGALRRAASRLSDGRGSSDRSVG